MSTNADQPAFPFIAGDQSNPDDRAICEGLTKREFFAYGFAKSLIAEYVKQPMPSIIELINAKAIKMADDLLTQLNKSI